MCRMSMWDWLADAGSFGLGTYLNHLSIEASILSITPILASMKNAMIPRIIPIPKACAVAFMMVTYISR